MAGELPTLKEDSDFEAPEQSKDDQDEIAPLPSELMPTPHVRGGGRYDKLPTHWDDPLEPAIGRVRWRVNPNVDSVKILPAIEGRIVGNGYEFLVTREVHTIAGEILEELKPTIKKDLDLAEGVDGVHFEQLGLGLTNVEEVAVQAVDINGLREKLSPSDYHDFVEEETLKMTIKIKEDIETASGQVLTPEYLKKVLILAMDIIGVDSEERERIIDSVQVSRRLSKKAAARLWNEGKIDENDINFVRSTRLVPDAMPRTVRREVVDSNENSDDSES